MNIKYTVIALLLSCLICKANHVALYMENDFFASTDHFYTHGTRLSYGFDYTNKIPLLPGRTTDIELSLTQLIFTPSNKSISENQPDNRPYAGFLGLSVNSKAQVTKKFQVEESVVVGLIGPHSYADEVQTQIHIWLKNRLPQGWDNQLHDEFILNYYYSLNYRLYQLKYFDILTKNENTVGNMFVYTKLGMMFRLGYNLPDDYGVHILEPSIKALSKKDVYSFYIFAYPDGRYVLRNIFLDGNTFEDSNSVEKESFVGDFITGFVARYNAIELCFSYIMRSKEFENQKRSVKFGSVSLTYYF